MSGPKVDIAEVRAQERRMLEAARNGRKKLFDKIQQLIKQVNNCFADMDLMMQDEALRPGCERIKALQDECCTELQRLLKTVKNGNEMLRADEIELKANELVKQFNNNIQGEIAIVKSAAQSGERYKQLQNNRAKLAQVRKKKFIQLSSADNNEQETVTQKDIEELAETFENEIKDFMSAVKMTGKHKNSILLIHNDLQDLLKSEIMTDRKEKRIKRLFGDYQKMTGMIKKEVSEMELIYAEYEKECFDLSSPSVSFNDFSSKKELENALTAAKENVRSHLSKEYIKRQIDNVMSRHGYDIVRSDMLTQANQNGQILYGVDKDTAINVFVSDENQVTMRVVGVGFDTEISDTEDERLYQQQCAFCSMHPKITAELAMRGVILHTKNHMLPDKKFNKKIQTKTKNNNQTTGRAKKELKRTELKTMHKE